MKQRILTFLALLLILAGFILSETAVALSGTVDYLRYDVEISINEDGSFHVAETQHVRFNGTYSSGFAEIPLDLLTNITNVQVSGGDTIDTISPYHDGDGVFSYSVEQERESIFVDWEFFSTNQGDEKFFIVEYDVIGGLWVYPDIHRLEWRAVAADRDGLWVGESQVTVNLPFTVTPDLLLTDAFGVDFTVKVSDIDEGQQIVYTATDNLPDGTPFQILLDFPSDHIQAELQAWQIAEDNAELVYNVDWVDVAMVVEENGNLSITEQQQVTVVEGVMHSGFRDISYLYHDEIVGLQVSEGEITYTSTGDDLGVCEYCYQISNQPKPANWAYYSEYLNELVIEEDRAGNVLAEWQFPALVRGESTIFTVSYQVEGAIRINEDGSQELSWPVAPQFDQNMDELMVHLSLPGRLGLEDVQIADGQASYDADGMIEIVPQTAVSTPSWQLDILLPPNATSASKPAWQQQLEQAILDAEAAQVRQSWIDLGWFVAKIGGGVIGFLGLLTGWYMWGSRKAREIMGNYRTTPPSDLPPGLVAYLMDKRATAKGALASLLYLANLELIRIVPNGELQIERIYQHHLQRGDQVTRANGGRIKVPNHVVTLFGGLRDVLSLEKPVSLTEIMPNFQRVLPDLYAAMGEEMVTHFYGDSKGKWRSKLQGFLPMIWVGGMGLIMFWLFTQSRFPSTNIVFAIFIGGFFLMSWAMRRLGNSSGTLSVLGKQEAQKWNGFKAYLEEIAQYADLEEAQEILEKYFAYAVALGVDETLLQQANALGADVPRWMGNGRSPLPTQQNPTWRNGRLRRWARRGSWLPRNPTKRPSTPAPRSAQEGFSLQNMSDQLTQSLSQANSKMTTMLETAVSGDKPTSVRIGGGGQSTKLDWKSGTSLDTMMSDIMKKTQSIKPLRPRSSRGYSSSGSGKSSGGFGSSHRRSSSRRSSSSRSSSSRRSSRRRGGGGGRRGFK